MDRSTLVRHFVRLVPALVWMGLIFAMSSRSTIPSPPAISTTIIAAMGHLVSYAVLAVLVFRGIHGQRTTFGARAIIAWAISTAYGLTDEFHQSFVPGRYASAEDLLLDAVGAAISLTLLYLVRRQRSNTEAVA